MGEFSDSHNFLVQSLSHVQFFVTPRTAAHQASWSLTVSQSLFKLMSTESVMLPNHHLIPCLPLLLLSSVFPSIRVFPHWVGCSHQVAKESIGVSASALVLPMNIQGWFPLGLTDLICLQTKGLSRVFSSTTVWKHQFFGAQPQLRTLECPKWTSGGIGHWILGLKSCLHISYSLFPLLRPPTCLSPTLLALGVSDRFVLCHLRITCGCQELQI